MKFPISATSFLLLTAPGKQGTGQPYIDWKEGKSYLDGEEFRKALEFAKKYADSDNTDKKAFAKSAGISDLFFIKDMYSYFQGSASLIGFPCKDGNGIYVRTNALYKNAATGNGEGVDAFLRFLISEREQERYAMYDIWKCPRMAIPVERRKHSRF